MARIIVTIIFGGGGLVMAYIGITQWLLQRELMARSSPVQAEILRSEVVTGTSADTDRRLLRDNSTRTYTAEVRFRYEVDGTAYESELLRPNIIATGFPSPEGAAELLTPFPVGAKVIAFVDHRHPDKAFLIKEEGNGPMVFIIVGLLLGPAAWFVGKYL